MFGEEVGLDAALEVAAPATAPLAALEETLAGLRWSSPRTAAKIKRFLKAKRALLTLPASDLCGDALALASAPGRRLLIDASSLLAGAFCAARPVVPCGHAGHVYSCGYAGDRSHSGGVRRSS